LVNADTNSTIETTPVNETNGSGNLLVNDSDPDGNSLTIQSINGNASGTVAGTYGTITWLPNGTYTYTPNAALDTLAASETVTEIFTETVSDGHGITVTTTLTILIHGENSLPVLTNDTNATVETTPVNETNGSGNILANDTDPDGDILAIIEVNGAPWPTVTGTYGTLVWHPNGTYTYTPNAALDSLQSGETVIETFHITVSDGHGGTAISTLTITIAGENDLPVLVNDINSTIGTTPVNETHGSGNILANDHDPDGDHLIITGIGGNTTGTVAGIYGTLVWNPNRTYTYTPNAAMDSLSANEHVNEIFTVSVSDGHGGVVTSLLTITIRGEIINHPPDAQPDYLTLREDTTNVLIDVLANDSDPDGDGLSISIISNPISGGTVSISGGEVVYNPPLNFNGNDYFIYQICDNGFPVMCDHDTVFIHVTPVNDAPVAETDYAATLVNPENPLIIDVQLNDIDVDLDNLTTSIISGPTSGGTASVINGDSVTYMPPLNFMGTDTIIYQICDNGVPSLCDIDTIFIRVVDQLP
jgi:VCBS repeat-containing protein